MFILRLCAFDWLLPCLTANLVNAFAGQPLLWNAPAEERQNGCRKWAIKMSRHDSFGNLEVEMGECS